MDSKLILEAARGTLDGSLSFPEVGGERVCVGRRDVRMIFCHPNALFRNV